MAVQDFLVSTVFIYHVTTLSSWGEPYVQTLTTMARMEEEDTVTIMGQGETGHEMGKIFVSPDAVISANDILVVGGVTYRAKRVIPRRNKQGVMHHKEVWVM